MHIAERYALSCGVQIENPFILDHFYPVVEAKYVCFHTSEQPTKDYDCWNVVKKLCHQAFERHGIKTIQIGDPKSQTLNCDIDFRGKLNIRQMANVIKNCEIFIGVDSFVSNVAAFYKKPLVSLFAGSYMGCSRPYWGDFATQFLIESPRTAKNPSFQISESPKTINNIKPEVVANKILFILEEKPCDFKTLYVGPRFRTPCLDIVPVSVPEFVSEKNNVRMDIHHDEEVLTSILKTHKSEITTNKPFKISSPKSIICINYVAAEFDEGFVKEAQSLGIKIILLCNSQQTLSAERKKLFDFEVNFFDPAKIAEENKVKLNINPKFAKTFSEKKVICGADLYDSLYEFSEKEDDFFVDLDWFLVYEFSK